ncbi:DUF3224 domain-containing protein [Streptomyces marincola]|uniref:DUF3224 domain-containing protein n=1 Tax=Streptomyces marincola TaxID=2878388 RepID=UPI001CF452D5|nr:DUF3224 domain-containing protein [Streptomyces marincola]UCM86681.1 DUF3224 domain-containing protein [Streptomyces marincola]
MPTRPSAPAGGSFTHRDWQETVVAGAADGPRLARVVVTNAYTGRITADNTRCLYSLSYAADGTGSFSGFERCEGGVDGHHGTFVLRAWGTFDAGGTVHCSFEVLPGSATGGLVGLRGTGGFSAAPGAAAVPYAFEPSYEEAAAAG